MIKSRENEYRPFIVTVLTAVMLFYAFSTESYKYFLPNINFFVLALLICSCFTLRTPKDINLVLCVLIALIHLLWNNYLMRQGTLFSGAMFPVLWLCYLAIRYTSVWHKSALLICVILGSCFIIGTYVVNIDQDIYYNIISPIYDNFEIIFRTRNPMAGITTNYGTNGLLMSFGICAFFAANFYTKRKMMPLRFIILLIMIMALLISGKRWISIAVILSISFAYAILKKNSTRFIFLKIIAVALISLCVILFMTTVLPSVNNVYDRFLIQAESNNMSTNRILLWGAAFKYFLESPIVGKGMFWFYTHVTGIESIPVNVHNCYLQLLLEVGVLGSIPFFMFFVIHMVDAVRLVLKLTSDDSLKGKSEIKYVLFSLVYQTFFHLMCFTGTALYQTETLVLYILSCAIVWYYKKEFQLYSRRKNILIR